MKVIQKEIGEQKALLTGYLHEYMPEVPDRTMRPAIIFCPGGGYEKLSEREADPPAFAFFAKGFQTFVLRYSIREKAGDQNPLRELSESVQMIRAHSEEWLVRKDQITAAGFSAGAHVAASLGVHFEKVVRGEKKEENRPDALLLCYPVITAGEFAHRGSIERVCGNKNDEESRQFWSLEKHVSPNTPPTFLWHTMNDTSVPVENSILFLQALHRNHVMCECHLFAEGIHGSSTCCHEVRTVNEQCAAWVKLSSSWLEKLFDFKE